MDLLSVPALVEVLDTQVAKELQAVTQAVLVFWDIQVVKEIQAVILAALATPVQWATQVQWDMLDQ
jgi:hypothetical protein